MIEWAARTVRPRHSEDRGAMAIVLAILTLVFAGFLAIVVDVGALYEERRDLQNGADAAAMAVAMACADGELSGTDCSGNGSNDTELLADQYAGDNANDDFALVDNDVVGDSDIIFNPDGDNPNEVWIRARTEDPSGGTNVEPFLSRIWGNSGTPVGAEAKAAWGSFGGASIIPITIGLCEFNIAIGNPDVSTYPTEGPVPGGQAEHTFYFHTSEGNPPPITPEQEACAGVAGMDCDPDVEDCMPGGFGWLIEDANCLTPTQVGEWFDAEPGNSPPDPGTCQASTLVGSTVAIPLFEDVATTDPPCDGSPPKCYLIYGFVGFEVTGFRFTGSAGSDWVDNPPCGNPHRCISGRFTNFTTLVGEIGGGPNHGAVVVQFTG